MLKIIKELTSCSLCGKVASRDELIIYHFPEGPKLVCKICYRQLPPDPGKRMRYPGKERKPSDDLFPPVD